MLVWYVVAFVVHCQKHLLMRNRFCWGIMFKSAFSCRFCTESGYEACWCIIISRCAFPVLRGKQAIILRDTIIVTFISTDSHVPINLHTNTTATSASSARPLPRNLASLYRHHPYTVSGADSSGRIRTRNQVLTMLSTLPVSIELAPTNNGLMSTQTFVPREKMGACIAPEYSEEEYGELEESYASFMSLSSEEQEAKYNESYTTRTEVQGVTM